MSNQTIEAIAAENKETRDRRQTLKAQKKAIEEAKDICANLAMRKELRMVGDPSYIFSSLSSLHSDLPLRLPQYAEEGADEETENSSDEEGRTKPPSRRQSVRRQPSNASSIQRHLSHQHHDTSGSIPRGAEIVSGGPRPSGYPTTPVATNAPAGYHPMAPPRNELSRAPTDPVEDIYSATPREPQQAPPPPPPRPSKVRHDNQDQGQAAPPQGTRGGEAYYGTGSSQYVSDGRRSSAYSGSAGINHAESAQRIQPKNIIGRA